MVVEVIVTLELDYPREDDLLRVIDVSQQLGVVRVECRLHLGGEGVQVEVTVLRQLGIDAGVEAEVVLVGVGRLSRLLQVKPFDDKSGPRIEFQLSILSGVGIKVECGPTASPSVLAPPKYQLEPLTYTERDETCYTTVVPLL